MRIIVIIGLSSHYLSASGRDRRDVGSKAAVVRADNEEKTESEFASLGALLKIILATYKNRKVLL